jgi:mycothiol synthase
MAEMKNHLPSGYEIRAATPADVAGIHNLLNLNAMEFLGHPDESLEDVERDLTTPHVNLVQDSRVVTRPDGFIAGYSMIRGAGRPQAPYLDMFLHRDEISAHPEIMDYLSEWTENQVRQNLSNGTIPPDVRVATLAFSAGNDRWYKSQLEKAGMTLIRHSFQMEIVFDQAPVAPVWPADFSLRYATRDEDWRPIYDTMRDAWHDHWGFVNSPVEEAYKRWKHYEDSCFTDGLWLLAMSGDRIAGISLCDPHADGDEQCGYVGTLGVRREYRRHGVAMALLRQSFVDLHRMGKNRTTLYVDASNLTGALRLYERAGMHVKMQYDLYEKELRAGIETRTTQAVGV